MSAASRRTVMARRWSAVHRIVRTRRRRLHLPAADPKERIA
ncbi:hypothetical protein AB0K00_16370 [Dactylosporangium sp. NPDC049525]